MVFDFGEWLKEWISVIADVSTILALIAAFFGLRSYAAAKEEREEQREKWWGRAQWGIDLAMSKEPARRMIGLNVLKTLAESSLTTADDIALFDALAQGILAEQPNHEDELETSPDVEPHCDSWCRVVLVRIRDSAVVAVRRVRRGC